MGIYMWVYSCIIQNEIERSAATLTRDTTSDLPIFFCLGEEFFLCSSSTRVNPTTRQSDDFLLYFFFFFCFFFFVSCISVTRSRRTQQTTNTRARSRTASALSHFPSDSLHSYTTLCLFPLDCVMSHFF